MEKIKIGGLKKEVFHEKLGNGLNVYMLNFKTKNFYISFTSKFGSSCTEYKDLKTNKKTQVKKGVAHFLEHQMFEEKGDNAFTKFSNLGVIANAYTSLDNTSYLVLGDKNFKECLNLVLDFVQSPYFIESNIDVERKIIDEEINGAEEDYILLAENILNKNLYKKDPKKDLITGSSTDIKDIHAKDLDKTYKQFYKPENMFIVITGNFYPLEAVGIIKENEKNKKFLPYKKVNITKYKEPLNVNKKYEIIHKNINVPIINIGYKMSKSNFKEIKEKDLSNLTDAFLFLTFGPSSDLNQLLIDENLTCEDINYSFNFTSNLLVITLCIKSKYIDEVINQLDKSLLKRKYSEDDLNRYKKVRISEYICNFDNIVDANNLLVNDLVNGNINKTYIESIKSLSVKALNKYASFIKNDNKSIVVID